MVGVYFSGTGNSKYCVECFIQEYNSSARAFSIENNKLFEQIKQNQVIVLGYPVQYSNLPKILRDFIIRNQNIWNGKHIFVIATMGLFSGDGTGVLARLLKKYGAVIIGGLHIKMPDSIADERVLKHSLSSNRKLVKKAEIKIKQAAINLKKGAAPQEGLGIFCYLAGLFGQRLYFMNKTKKYSNKLNINSDNCIRCGNCVKLCPMDNITIIDGIAISDSKCTMCYRCINYCPKQAITLLGKTVIEQGNITKYIV